ncbi:MAG: hypothetical protein H6Q99_3518 [Proteobacteria bacterium]|nr:hypothetical protein [Pseudomonadota bacterium]
MKMRVPEHSGGGTGAASLSDDLRILAQAFACRWRLIAMVISVFVVCGLAVVWLSPKTFTSSASVFIDPRPRTLVDFSVTPTGMGSSSQGADGALVDSQLAIITSQSVLGKLVEREGLDREPAIGSEAPGLISGLRSQVRSLLYGPDDRPSGGATAYGRALVWLQKAIEVKRVDNTYVLDIAVTTKSAERSAALANALADIYLSDGQDVVDDSARQSATSLEQRLAELGRVSEASQRAVEAYRQQNDLIDSEGVLIAERQLTELSSQLVSASVAAEAARASLDMLRLSGAAASTSPQVAQLHTALDQAAAEERILAATFGPRHPRLIRAQMNRQSLQTALDAEMARQIASADADLQGAARKKASLEEMMTRTQQTLSGSKTASVKLRELEETARQNRELFDSFATKAKQAREQVSLPTTTARIISPARPAERPSGPRALVVLAASAFLGAVAGFGIAWIAYLVVGAPKPRRARPPYDPRHLMAAE